MTTYPPDDHLLRDLQIESWLEAEDHAFAELEVTDAVLAADGTVALGALVTLVDLACARVSFAAAHPHWIATADLSLATSRPVTEGTAVAEARVARAGSKLISIEIDLHDVGTAAASFVRIPKEASRLERALPAIGERTRMELLGERPASIVDKLDFRPVPGGVELDRREYVYNSFGAINGGVLGYLVSAAAEQVTDFRPADVVLRYLGQAKVGPAVALATVVRSAADHAVCDVVVRDAGADGLLLARSTVTCVRR